MHNFRNIQVLLKKIGHYCPAHFIIMSILFLLLLLVSDNVFAQYISINNTNYLIINKNTNISINAYSNLLINANIVLYSNIKGEGVMIIQSDKITALNANNDAIQNLCINSCNRVELTGNIKINSRITIINGKLMLGNFNLLLLPEASINNYTLQHIIKNGMGSLIQQKTDYYIAFAPFPVSSQLPQSITATIVDYQNSKFSYIETGCSAFFYNNNLTDVYIGTKVPPPKFKLNYLLTNFLNYEKNETFKIDYF